MTTFIFIGSVGHAAANFAQYEQYGYPPNYPTKLYGERPKNKVNAIGLIIININYKYSSLIKNNKYSYHY